MCWTPSTWLATGLLHCVTGQTVKTNDLSVFESQNSSQTLDSSLHSLLPQSFLLFPRCSVMKCVWPGTLNRASLFKEGKTQLICQHKVKAQKAGTSISLPMLFFLLGKKKKGYWESRFRLEMQKFKGSKSCIFPVSDRKYLQRRECLRKEFIDAQCSHPKEILFGSLTYQMHSHLLTW